VQIKVLGGGHTVGGNKILVNINGRSVWFDMGISYDRRLELPEYSIMRGFSLQKIVSMGYFPINDIMNSAKEEDGKRYINVLLSHAHADHYGLMTYFRAWEEAKVNIRVYCPTDTFRTLQTRLELGNLKKVLTNLDYRKPEEAEAESFHVNPVRVDHSMDAACGYIVTSPKFRIGYTGDFRFTSENEFNAMTRAFEDLDILITEGTRIVDHGLQTEEDVKDQIKRLLMRFYNSTVVFIVGWYTYTKRVKTIIEAAGGRKVVLHSKVAAMLEAADPTILSDPNVFVIQIKEKEKLPSKAKIMTLTQVNEAHGDVVVVLPEIQKLYLWREETGDSILVRPGDIVVSSLSEPYDEDSARGLVELANWVTKELRVPVYHIHASGHAPIHQIADFVNTVKPKKVYVVHSYAPEILKPLIQKPTEVVIQGSQQ